MMLGKGEMGTPVIDELRVCYIADPSLLADLARIEIGKSWKLALFTLFRQGSDAYDVLFAICIGGLGDYQQIGLLKFGRYGAKEAPYAYYKVSNEALYSPDILRLALSLPEMLGMVFNNFTAIDIAIDYRKTQAPSSNA